MEQKNIAVPVSILIAGVLIAGAVYFRGDSSGTGPNLRSVKLEDVISELDIDKTAYEACIKDPATAAKVREDETNALAMVAEGTPFSVIINARNQKMVVPGAYPKADLEALLAAAAAATSSDPSLESVTAVSASDHVLGNPNATLTVVEYSDLRCPFCARFHETMNDIVKNRTDVKWVYRHYPLDELHPDARTLAIASECVASVGNNDKFWQFTDRVFELGNSLVTN